MRVSVVGGGAVPEEHRETAERLGRALAERGHVVVCGGRGGVMRAACSGTKEAGGETIGILPGTDPNAANGFVDTAIATDMGHGRNALIPLNGDAVVAVDGGPRTLSEIGFAAIYGRPVAGPETYDLAIVEAVETPSAAVAYDESAVDGE